MIERIGKHLLLKIAQRPDRLRLFGDLERGARGGNRRIVALGFGNEGECLFRLFERTGRDIATRKSGERQHVGAVLGEQLRIQVGGGRGIAFGERGVGRLQQILFLGADRAFGDAFEKRRHLALGQRAHEAVDWLPIWPGMAGCSSMFILASLTLPLAAFTAFSRTGVSCLQGPHHGAQKSTSTGWCLDSSITSFMKACVVVSLTTSAAVAVAIIVPPSCSIVSALSGHPRPQY